MKCEYSHNGNKCSHPASKILRAGISKYHVCKKHYYVWKKMINGSMLSPNEKSRQEDKEEFGCFSKPAKTSEFWNCREV